VILSIYEDARHSNKIANFDYVGTLELDYQNCPILPIPFKTIDEKDTEAEEIRV